MSHGWSLRRVTTLVLLWAAAVALGAWFDAFPAGLWTGALALALVLVPAGGLFWFATDQAAQPATWLPTGNVSAVHPPGARELRTGLLSHWIADASSQRVQLPGATDPLRSLLRELAEDRLVRHRGTSLADPEAQTLLGPEVHAYLTTRAPVPPRRLRQTLTQTLDRIEAL